MKIARNCDQLILRRKEDLTGICYRTGLPCCKLNYCTIDAAKEAGLKLVVFPPKTNK